MKPKLLDLFCKAGGASVGYARAGFEVEGVDIEPQPHYPFKFYQADALEFPLKGYDAYHASPPCQEYSWATQKSINLTGTHHPDLIEATRLKLTATGAYFIIENVVGSPLKHLVWLQGTMFGLKVIRRRHFEMNFPCMMPGNHQKRNAVKNKEYYTIAGHHRGTIEQWSEAMGINWMSRYELTQAIPPIYTEYIGKRLIEVLSESSNL